MLKVLHGTTDANKKTLFLRVKSNETIDQVNPLHCDPIAYRDSSPKNKNSVIIYSCSICPKPV